MISFQLNPCEDSGNIFVLMLNSFSFSACFEITGISQIRAAALHVEYRIEAETFVEGKKFSRVLFYNGRKDRPQVVNQTVMIKPRSGASNRYCSNETVFLKVNFAMTYWQIDTLSHNDVKI